MAIVIALRWDGKTATDYDAVMRELDFESDPARGAIVHLCCATDEGLRICDVWESEEQWNRFLGERLQPAIARTGLEGMPEVETAELYNLYAPDPDAVAKMGGSPLPA
jgi:hypothetical protein